MTSPLLDAPGGPLLLRRPGAGDPSLRAWDAADEQLLGEAHDRLHPGSAPKVLVVDDTLGALTLGLDAFLPTVVADSAAFASALAGNLDLNPGVSGPRDVHNWGSPPEGRFDVILLRIPRHGDYLAWLLRWVNDHLAEGGLLLAGGMIKHLPDRSVEVFAGAVETEQVLPARKKARVFVCRKGPAGLADWPGVWKGYSLEGGWPRLEALPAVFSRERLDIGTRALLPHVEELVRGLPPAPRILDLACGNGVLGLVALIARPDSELVFSDVSSQALLSARHNAGQASPERPPVFLHGDGIVGDPGPFDLILLNPPFHDGGAVGDHVALRLFSHATRQLSGTGRLLMVGNRHLGYHRSLKRFFSKVRQRDATPKFVVFEAC